MRAAASRTFCTAGSSSPIRMAMMAMTTNNSIRVKPGRKRDALMETSKQAQRRQTTNNKREPAFAQKAKNDPRAGRLNVGSRTENQRNPLRRRLQCRGVGFDPKAGVRSSLTGVVTRVRRFPAEMDICIITGLTVGQTNPVRLDDATFEPGLQLSHLDKGAGKRQEKNHKLLTFQRTL